MKLKISVLALIFGFLFAADLHAQYEGEINYIIYNPNNSMGDAANMELVFTRNRIFVNSNISMNVMAGLSARGVLVRNDQQDFIVITTDDEGLKVEKTELDGLVNIMNRVQGRDASAPKPAFDWENKVVETGNSQTIHGKRTHEYVLKGDNEGEHISVWLTDEIKVDWGLLLDAWQTTGKNQLDHEIPIEMVMNKNSFPLLVEAYKNNEVIFRARAVSVNNRTFDRSKTEVPSDLKLLSLADLMMNFFRQQR